MKLKIFLLLFLIYQSDFAFAQTKKFEVSNQNFIIQNKKVSNEWNTKDDVRNLYIKEKEIERLLLTYFAYKDEGGDCNNLFWDKEWLEVKNGKIVITTHHFQKTGLDPITEWEKKTFTVSNSGEVILTKHLYKKYGTTDWKESEEWYK